MQENRVDFPFEGSSWLCVILNIKFSPASPAELFASASFLLELVRSKLLIHTVHSDVVLFSFLYSNTFNVLSEGQGLWVVVMLFLLDLLV